MENLYYSFKRIIHAGWINFGRNGGSSAATCFILVMTILLITFLFLFQGALQFLISILQEKADISIYFKPDSQKETIFKIKEELSKIPQVKSIKYVSKEEVLEDFIKRHKDDPILMKSLEEVGGNPFLPALNIQTWQAAQYIQITQFLENSTFKETIEKINYYQAKPVIDKLFSITSGIALGGIVLILVLGLFAILVAFLQTRLAIYNLNQEIEIMRLVGASNWFIKGPFLVQGIIVGLISTLISLLILIPALFFLAPKLEIFLPGFNIFNYFSSNFFTILLIQLGTSIGIVSIASLIATRKYLKI